MLYCSNRKRAISGWLKQNQIREFYSSLKLQKFLFFYEALSKVENDTSEFRALKGYANGPVFSDVYGDYTYQYDEFSSNVDSIYQMNPETINEDRAKFVGFLVKILSESELSEITHELNIWSTKEDDINRGVKQVPLREEDLNEDDSDLLRSLRNMYSIEYIDSVEVIQISGKSFIIKKTDIPKLTDEQKSVFITLANNQELENPVYISVSDDGVVLVD
ncbi:hypothetical protein O9H85_08250 [Paenibacillus filicis]|uniref:Antitoxin SocA-like Panacea domain-containing protein n=1 Tax=Paenibacillus gyeongsangnamensis TaxID=3388067 RepID=A0ABT4Q6C0_9BACL|nr:hypothetical protein [Paenibacillus filicis]MCZ8512424.1 hypothetical protein [Paenibacillus filicis]